MADKDLKDVVKDKYAQAARRVTAGGDASCSGTAASRGERDPITSNLYGCGETSEVPTEAFRVLKPGGRFAVSDVVVRGAVPAAIRRSMELWIGCVAGALEEQEYRDKLAKAGFDAIGVEPTRVYRVEDAREFFAGSGIDVGAIAPQVEGKFMS